MVGWLARFALVAVLLAGTASAAEPIASQIAEDEGRVLAQRWCVTCHVVAPKRSGTDAVPTFQAIAQRPGTTVSRLKGYLLKPHGEMPDFQLSFPDIDRIITYIMSLKTGG